MTRVEYSAVQAENDVLRAQNRKLRDEKRELVKKVWSLVTTRGFESFEDFKRAMEE